VFYGGDIREAHLPWLRDQVRDLAALPPVDDDGDMPLGLFVVSDERAAVRVWEVREQSGRRVEGGVAVRLADGTQLYYYVDEHRVDSQRKPLERWGRMSVAYRFPSEEDAQRAAAAMQTNSA